MPPRRKRAAATTRARTTKRPKPRTRTLTPSPQPSPTPEPAKNLYEVVDGIPVSQTAPDYGQLKNPLSIVETGALLHTLHRSRNVWLAGEMFHKYWTRPPRGRKLGAGEVNAREKMTKLCECSLEIGPHIFEVKLFMVKDDLVMEEMIEAAPEDTHSPHIEVTPSPATEGTPTALKTDETTQVGDTTAFMTNSIGPVIANPSITKSTLTEPTLIESTLTEHTEPTEMENMNTEITETGPIKTEATVTEPLDNQPVTTTLEFPPQISQTDGPSRAVKSTSNSGNAKKGSDELQAQAEGEEPAMLSPVVDILGNDSSEDKDSKYTNLSEGESTDLVESKISVSPDESTSMRSKDKISTKTSQNMNSESDSSESVLTISSTTVPALPSPTIPVISASNDSSDASGFLQEESSVSITSAPPTSTNIHTQNHTVPTKAPSAPTIAPSARTMVPSARTMAPPAPTVAPSVSAPSSASVPQSNRDALHSPENQAMIAKLHEMARNTPSLLELMKIVASGNAQPEQIARFQTYIAQARAENAAMYRQQQLQLQQPLQRMQPQSQSFGPNALSNPPYYQQQHPPSTLTSSSHQNGYQGQPLQYQHQYNQQYHGPLQQGYMMNTSPMMSQGYKPNKVKAPRVAKPKRVKAPKLPKPPKAPKALKAPKATKVLKSSTVVFEFKENPINRYLVPKDAIVEVVESTGEVLISMLSLHNDVPELAAEIEYKIKETNYKELLAEQAKRKKEREKKLKAKSKKTDVKEAKEEKIISGDNKEILENDDKTAAENGDSKDIESNCVLGKESKSPKEKNGQVHEGIENAQTNEVGINGSQDDVETINQSNSFGITATAEMPTATPTNSTTPVVEQIGQSDGSSARILDGDGEMEEDSTLDISDPNSAIHAEDTTHEPTRTPEVDSEIKPVADSEFMQTKEPGILSGANRETDVYSGTEEPLALKTEINNEINTETNAEAATETDKTSDVSNSASQKDTEQFQEIEIPKLPPLELTEEELCEKYEGIKYSPVTIVFRGVPAKLVPIVACTVNDQSLVYQKMEAIIKYGVKTKKNYAWLQVEADDQELIEQLKQPAKPPSNMYVPARIRVYKKRPPPGVGSGGMGANSAGSPAPEQDWQSEEPVSKKIRHNLMVADLPVTHS